ncbi:MAG: fatty acid desaturase family protein [Gemmatimonadota bacterium]|nr:fatty acid desaturase family protein [Gemmatimonadota bacterium]
MTQRVHPQAPENPAWQHPLHLAGLLAFAVLAVILGQRLAVATPAFGHGWHLLALAIAGYIVADLVSGLVHFLADNFGSETTPFFGPGFIRPFREHHTDPRGIVAHGFVTANGNNALVSLPFLAFAALLLPVGESAWAHLLGGFLLFMMLAVFVTNQFHKWAHMESPPRLARWLQASGLILSREHHDVHHTEPHNAHYCITIGLWDPLLERTHFFERLERGMRRWVPGLDPLSRVEREHPAHG